MPENKPYPRDFKWGTATSSYQIEGAPTAGGKGPSVWDTFSHIEGKIKNGDTGDRACDHYHLWRDDIGLLKNLGVNAYRFSISWPRIFPTGKENEPNQIGLDFYSRLVDALLENQITPFITLNHWDIPQGLEDIGGWTERDIVHDFVKYSYHVSRHLGDRVKHWITHNEPWCVSYIGYIGGHKPPGLKNNWVKSLAAAHHLLLSHGMAIPEIRNNSKQSDVGITLNLNTAIPASGSTYDEDACRFFDGQFNRLYLNPLYNNEYPDDVFEYLKTKSLISESDLNFIKQGDLNIISTKTDFLGVNYYSRAVIRNEEIDEKKNLPRNVEMGPKTDFGWEIYPPGIYDLLMRLKKEYKVQNIYITENGCSYSDGPNSEGKINDKRRIEYYRSHLTELKRAIEDGVPCSGYFAWSLMDNFEWAQGFSQRFGLIWVDFETLERIPKDSYYWYKKYISANGLDED
ncbi:MAG: beta-glucosidase [Candidatus Marinimicrobia bacterium]|nr:beta-glucosidase [Candidatus Neomarinimicrobiota bacterium]MBT4370774.1 beta-glucosidase [Candidatus Neomarinimicrobiota bacterium]MBT7119033.1 beta-glucosidase [Candidatus Neomarinimicrobiota bacterium]